MKSKSSLIILLLCFSNLIGLNYIHVGQSAPFWYPDLNLSFKNANGTLYSTQTILVEWDFQLTGGIYGEGVVINDTSYYEQVNWINNFTIYSPKNNIIYQKLTDASLLGIIDHFEYDPQSEGFEIGTEYAFTFRFVYWTESGGDEHGSFGNTKYIVSIVYQWNYSESNYNVYIILGIGLGLVVIVGCYLLNQRSKSQFCDPNRNPNNFYYDPNCSKERIKRGLPY